MHNQHEAVTRPGLSPAAGWAVLSAVCLALLAGAVYLEAVLAIPVGLAIVGLLAATAAIGGCGYIVRSAQAAVTRHMLEIKAMTGQPGPVDEESATALRRLNLRLLNTSN